MFAEKKRRHMSIDSPQMADNFLFSSEWSASSPHPKRKKVWIELNSTSSLPRPVDDVVVDDHRTVYQTILLLRTQKVV